MLDNQLDSNIVRMYWSGSSPKEISKQVGYSYWYVCKVLKQAGGELPKSKGYKQQIPSRALPAGKVLEIRTLADQDFDIVEISTMVGVSPRTVKKYAPDARRRLHTTKTPDEIVEQIGELVKLGTLSASEIARRTGVSTNTVKKYYPQIAMHDFSGALPQDVIDKMRLFVEDETPLGEIAKTFNVATSTIKKYFPNAGVGRKGGAEVRRLQQRAEEIYEQWGV